MIHLKLAKQILELSEQELAEILAEIQRSNPDLIQELEEKVFWKQKLQNLINTTVVFRVKTTLKIELRLSYHHNNL